MLSRHIFRSKSRIKPSKVWLFLCNVYLMLYWRNYFNFSFLYLKNFEWFERFVFRIRRIEKMFIPSDDNQMVNRIRDSNWNTRSSTSSIYWSSVSIRPNICKYKFKKIQTESFSDFEDSLILSAWTMWYR